MQRARQMISPWMAEPTEAEQVPAAVAPDDLANAQAEAILAEDALQEVLMEQVKRSVYRKTKSGPKKGETSPKVEVPTPKEGSSKPKKDKGVTSIEDLRVMKRMNERESVEQEDNMEDRVEKRLKLRSY